MDYEQEQPVYKKPKQKRSWPWIILAAVLVLGLSSVLHILNFPAIRVEKSETGITIYLGNTAKTPAAEADTPIKPAPEAHLGSGETVTIGASVPGAETYVSPGAMSLQEIYERTLPSVVTITSPTALGTGVIMSETGYIITNQHVVEDAGAITVQLWDDTACPAALVGSDTASDLAVLKVEAQNLTPASFGDSEGLRVGDTVVAIGNPLGTGLKGTMTDGILSGINRDMTVGGRKMTLLQTNAALNSGNSGGPLINCYGQVIGINTAKLTDSYQNSGVEGLGFAIPMATVKPIVDELIEKGYVSGRPAIGVVVEEVPLRARIYFGLPEGAYVSQVDESSDAYAQGLRAGDIIVAMGGEPVTGSTSLGAVKDGYNAGDAAVLTLFRDGRYFEITVTLMDQVTDVGQQTTVSPNFPHSQP